MECCPERQGFEVRIQKHLVISAYNNEVAEYTQLGIPFTIYDQSDKAEIAERLERDYDTLRRSNCGHSLSNMFEYICENYENLPEVIIFLKSNVVPRHCTKEYFEENINNDFYTQLYHEDNPRLISRSSDYLMPGYLLEENNSWYCNTKEHHLFCNFGDFYKFLFNTDREPEWLLFSPGACFIVESARIRRYPKSFWHALGRISSYVYFPAEAFMVERILPAIFQSSIPLQPWMNDTNIIDEKINKILSVQIRHSCGNKTIKDRVLRRLKISL